jgi:hypothetical protein
MVLHPPRRPSDRPPSSHSRRWEGILLVIAAAVDNSGAR